MDALERLAEAAAARRSADQRAAVALATLKAAIRAAHGQGASEYEIARVGQCDRMTVRRALGKL